MVPKKVPSAKVKEKRKLAIWRVAKSHYLEAIHFLVNLNIIIPIASRENESVAREIINCHLRAFIYRLLIVLMVNIFFVYYSYIVLYIISQGNFNYLQFRFINCRLFTLLLALIMMLPGDVDSADNEDETDSEAQIQTKANHGRNHNKALQKCHVYENNENNDVANPSLECNVSNIMSNNCYSNNSHSVFRPSQLLRTRVKHETKL